MTLETQSKVQARHLKRHAYLYIRQSSLRQGLRMTVLYHQSRGTLPIALTSDS